MNTAKINMLITLDSAGFIENPDEILEVKEFDDRFIFLCEFLVCGVEAHFCAGEFFKPTLTRSGGYAGLPFSESLLKEEVKKDFDSYTV